MLIQDFRSIKMLVSEILDEFENLVQTVQFYQRNLIVLQNIYMSTPKTLP